MKRIRIRVVMVPVLLMALVAAGQEHLQTFSQSDTSRVQPGVRLGFNASNLWGPDMRAEGGLMHFGAYAGGIAQINLTDRFVLETGVGISMKGTRYVDTSSLYLEERKWALDLFYLEIPVIAKLRFPVEGVVVPFMGIGPTANIRVYSQKRRDTENVKRQYSLNDTTTAFDVAATGVAGVHLMTGTIGHLLGEVRARLGLLSIRDDMIARNWSGTVSVAYVFNLKRPEPLW